MSNPFVLIAPSTRGISLALTRHFLLHTKFPVYATFRSKSAEQIRQHILSPFSSSQVDPSRLCVIPLDLASEESIKTAADSLQQTLPNDSSSYFHAAFFTGGLLHPEKQPSDLDISKIRETFQINVISHLLLIKHFSRFLPTSASSLPTFNGQKFSKWVHVSARVGSISDNRLGGWYSYRSSKAALNQVIRTFDLHLKVKRIPAICVGVHPGTVKTDLSKAYWGGVQEGKLFEPDYAADCLVKVVQGLEMEQRGRIWDWAGKEILP